jgi:uncharacterized SAM-binding protein YcdF (DUF218 family)
VSAEASVPSRRRRWVRVRRIGLGVVAVLLVTWLVLCFLIVQHPTINRVTKADAIVVLGPPDNSRVNKAQSLLAAGIADHLVISVPNFGFPRTHSICRDSMPGVTTTCFGPNPATTRGEAQEVARLVAENNWHTIVVVTSKFHVSRARMILDRCVNGRVEVISAHEDLSASDWAYQYVYQTAGYVRAFVQGGC